ncbi:DUF4145 domain-containing protein [Vibrio mimicus]|uniref:DUF4145 domain-containing protein n=1 Tax=Vibrio mimicus TaxID=674 RepID=UPI002A347785|nr:DUF4145 domain-containing protein [Vibrio cholerae]HDG1518790.1 DUF4145 domain-containing protein [Vibrio cholerae]
MKYISPEFLGEGFNCPTCDTYAHMDWTILSNRSKHSMFQEATCSRCKQVSLWRVLERQQNELFGITDKSGVMIFPDRGNASPAEVDMPEDVKRDYEEAASIFNKSPRGSAALLRLGLQKLCKHLGESGKNINNDIRALAEKNVLPPMVIKVADTVRITGNNAVHPGEMSDEDFDFVASKLFDLINFIVKKGITEPKELEELYGKTPEAPRKAAERQDQRVK